MVINSKVEYIRKNDRNGNKFNNLKCWIDNCEDGVYIGRKGIVFYYRRKQK